MRRILKLQNCERVRRGAQFDGYLNSKVVKGSLQQWKALLLQLLLLELALELDPDAACRDLLDYGRDEGVAHVAVFVGIVELKQETH